MANVHRSIPRLAPPVGQTLEPVHKLVQVRAHRAHLGWLVVAGLALGGCAATPRALESPAVQPSFAASAPASSQAGTGAYLNFATCDPVTLHERTGTTQVYFFHQADCPECATTDAALLAEGVPDGFTVFKVDLPSMSELADRYGVTEPDTFVQVDATGNRVRSWTGSRNGADIAARAT